MNAVYTFGPAWDLPDPSPFCTKLLSYLKLADYVKRFQSHTQLLAD